MRQGRMALVLAVLTVALLGAFTGAWGAVTPPDSISGPPAAAVGDAVTLSPSGAACSTPGHTLEYRLDWGDETALSAWFAAGASASHTYAAAGTYQVKAQARCPADSEESTWYSGTEINILDLGDEAILAPAKPTGYTVVLVGEERSYSTSGGASNVGHPLEYLFSWGDDTQSAWSSSPSASHAFAGTGTFVIRAKARCRLHPEKESGWSPNLTQSVALQHSFLRPPSRPDGLKNGYAGLTYDYSAWGAEADCGDALEYQFDWNGAGQSEWGPAVSEGAGAPKYTCSHLWTAQGTYYVKARARCPLHGIVSDWSLPFMVSMGPGEVISTPNAPTPPDDLRVDVPGLFTTSGATSSLGHSLEYQFRWGDGSEYSPWTGSPSATHVYTAPGTYDVKCQARCIEHPERVSSLSPCISVTVRVLENLSPPDPPEGPTSAAPGVSVSFTTGGSTSDLGHAVVYQFDWGDNTSSGWGEASGSHVYAAAGHYNIKARARCAEHEYAVSPDSPAHGLEVAGEAPETVTAPYQPGGPSTGVGGDPLTYTTGGSTSNLGHAVVYQFDWADGSDYSAWSAEGTGQHAWTNPGTYMIRARARCAEHTDIMSDWSGPKAVVITGGSYPVTWEVLGQGSVTLEPQKDSYELGEQITVTAVPATGWRFHHWGGDASGYDNPLTLTVTGAMHLVAVFGQGSYVLHVNTEGSGSVHISPDKLAYAPGEWVQLVANPGEGHSFAQWSGDLSGTTNPVVLAMDADKEITAQFVPLVCTLEIVTYPEGGGSVTVTPLKETYAWGEVVQLSGAANPGHEFNHWGGDVFSLDNPAQVTITGNMRIKAIFSLTSSEHFPIPEAQESWINLAGGISVCGLPAQPGDQVAVYDAGNQLCGQFTIVDPEGEYGVIKVWGDDPGTPEDEGAAAGDILTLVLWDKATDTETELEATIPGGLDPLDWTATGEVIFAELATVCQESIPLVEGWNLISYRTNRLYHATPEPPAVGTLEGTRPVTGSVAGALSSIDGQWQAVRSFDGAGAHSYDPTLPEAVNDLTYLAPGYGYWIKVSQDCTLTLEGGRVRPQARLALEPGWNLTGCWGNSVLAVGEAPAVGFATPPTPQTVAAPTQQELLPGLIGAYDVLRSFDALGAHTYDPTLPDFLSDLTYVGPGYGYWLKMRSGMWLSY